MWLSPLALICIAPPTAGSPHQRTSETERLLWQRHLAMGEWFCTYQGVLSEICSMVGRLGGDFLQWDVTRLSCAWPQANISLSLFCSLCLSLSLLNGPVWGGWDHMNPHRQNDWSLFLVSHAATFPPPRILQPLAYVSHTTGFKSALTKKTGG